MLLAVTSLGIFGIILGGWASNNKYSILGGMRSSAQMISYELSVSLAVVGLLMVYGEVGLTRLVEAQAAPLRLFGFSLPLPAWGVFLQPVGFLLFLVGMFAETNRNPFDLAEGVSELVAGFHVEYSSMKFALFFMGEYSNMTVASLVIATLFLGGYQVPFASADVLRANPKAVLGILAGLAVLGGVVLGWIFMNLGRHKVCFERGVHRIELFVYAAAVLCLAAVGAGLLVALPGLNVPVWLPGPLAAMAQFACLMAKALFFCWLFVWVRWTLPRFRYDQLMDLGWKMMLPLALLNVAVTCALVLLQR
jgi:NADH-quinone oxidoreductase subunit H